MLKQFNNFDDDQKTVQQQSFDEILLVDQDQESDTGFNETEETDYIVNEQDQDEFVNEFVNEEDDFLPGPNENPGDIPEEDDDEDENEEDEEAADDDTENIDIESEDDIDKEKRNDEDVL